MFDLADLDSRQRKIVENGNGVVVVKAGPGTGKTRTLTYRAAYLITHQKINPQNIVVLTFTRRAALELQNRLNKLLNVTGNTLTPTVTTFHSLAYKLLEKEGVLLDLVSEQEYQFALGQVIDHLDLKISKRDLSLLFTKLKNNSLVQPGDKDVLILDYYQQQLQMLNKIDYDDLLLNLLHLIEQKEEYCQTLQQMYPHILIDEFQDTNEVQYQIIKKTYHPSGSLFVIGDPFQSIYQFRGANPQIFEKLKQDFPGIKEESLETNYRSFAKIVQTSNLLFSGLNTRSSFLEQAGRVVLVKTLNEYAEADWIVNCINNKIGGTDLLNAQDLETITLVGFADFAIVYRSHQLNKALAKKLNRSGLPYQIIGEGSYYEEENLAFLCMLLEYLYQPTPTKLKEVLCTPFLNLPTKDLEVIRQEPHDYLNPLIQDKLDRSKNLTIVKLSDLVNQLVKIWGIPIPDESLNFFLSVTVQFDKFQDGLERFYYYYQDLKAREFHDPKGDRITLLTMHAAKGLEFKHVFMIGFEEGLIPHNNSYSDPTQLEEEKRLLYVAMTRAKEESYLIYTQKRQHKPTQISRYQELIKSSVLEEIEDEATGKIIKRMEKAKIKKSQMGLF